MSFIAACKRLADYAEWLVSLEESDYDPNSYSKAQMAADITRVLGAPGAAAITARCFKCGGRTSLLPNSWEPHVCPAPRAPADPRCRDCGSEYLTIGAHNEGCPQLAPASPETEAEPPKHWLDDVHTCPDMTCVKCERIEASRATASPEPSVTPTDGLAEALEDATITMRNYYASAISRGVVDEKLARYRRALEDYASRPRGNPFGLTEAQVDAVREEMRDDAPPTYTRSDLEAVALASAAGVDLLELRGEGNIRAHAAEVVASYLASRPSTGTIDTEPLVKEFNRMAIGLHYDYHDGDTPFSKCEMAMCKERGALLAQFPVKAIDDTTRRN